MDFLAQFSMQYVEPFMLLFSTVVQLLFTKNKIPRLSDFRLALASSEESPLDEVLHGLRHHLVERAQLDTQAVSPAEVELRRRHLLALLVAQFGHRVLGAGLGQRVQDVLPEEAAEDGEVAT